MASVRVSVRTRVVVVTRGGDDEGGVGGGGGWAEDEREGPVGSAPVGAPC